MISFLNLLLSLFLFSTTYLSTTGTSLKMQELGKKKRTE
jgi:hypothetical protein